jgi:benzylsuccinate CoA-transferase BbsF subunit
MLSTCLRGQTGPERKYTGFGGQGAALAGLFSVTGWPDRAPTGPWGAYTDFINPRFGVAALAAALHHRALTGEGQHIDLAQTEAGIRFIEPLVLDYTVNGRTAGQVGHDSAYAAPSGVFRTSGTERYVAIAVETPEQWGALLRTAPLSAFEGDAFADPAARQLARQEIGEALAAWCAGEDAFELPNRLRAAGVPAHTVLRPSDLHADAQLAHRQFFVPLEHAEAGPILCDGHVTRFSATPNGPRHAAPCLGEHNEYVLRELLQVSEEDIARYAASGALT